MSIVSASRHIRANQAGSSRPRGDRGAVKVTNHIDEFDDDDLMLDEEAENSLAQIEEVFQQTQQHRAQSQIQRLSQQPYSQVPYDYAANATSKRARSPQDGSLDANRQKAARRVDQTVAEDMHAENDRIIMLTKQLAEKAAEAEKFKQQMYAKDGEVKLLRGNMNNTIAQYTSMLREREEAISVQKLTAQQFKQANEALVNENRTLKSFRVIEANTNTSHHLWSSVSASVSRRRAQAAASRNEAALGSGGRDPSQSLSQSHAATIGLITPTKKNRSNGNRNLGSPSTSMRGDDSSPTSGRGRTSAVPASSTAKRASFPGFVNSFAKPFVVKETQPDISAVRHRREISDIPDNEVFLDHSDVMATQPLASQSSGPSRPHEQTIVARGLAVQTEGQDAGDDGISIWWGEPRLRHLWAVKTYSQRQGHLASLILAHGTSPVIQSKDGRDDVKGLPVTTTLHRLIHVSLPHDCPLWLREEYDLAANSFLTSMSRGTPMDADTRFASLLEKLPYEEDDITEQERVACDQVAQVGIVELIDQGIADVLEGLTTSLRFMMAIAFKVGDYERVCDVLALTRSIASHYPVVLRFIVVPLDVPASRLDAVDSGDPGIEESESSMPRSQQGSNEDATQHDVAASLCRRNKQRLEFSVDRIMLGCIEFASSSAERQDKEDTSGTAVNIKILSAVVGMFEVMVLQIGHDDDASLHCSYKLRTMMYNSGTLASLLDARRSSAQPIQRMLDVLTHTCQHDTLWRVALACRPDKRMPQSRSAALAAVSPEESMLFEVLAKLLVDGRLTMNTEWLHRVHRSAINFVSQLAICQKEEAAATILNSGPILAAVVKCLQLDTQLIWTSECAIPSGQDRMSIPFADLEEAVDRICMDVQLLARLFIDEGVDEQMLSKKLARVENQLLLNGLRHHFIEALSRVAFASEPSWMIEIDDDDRVAGQDDEVDDVNSDGQKPSFAEIVSRKEKCRSTLNEANELATSLLEMVLSPDEIESCWEAMVEDEDDDDGDDRRSHGGEQDTEMGGIK